MIIVREGAFALWLGLSLIACSQRSAYRCDTAEQCVLNGQPGTCEPEGFCSFPDTTCPNGQRFEPHAGDGLGGQCSATPPIDAPPPPCGEIGQACCANETEAPCETGLSCTTGTCQECVQDIALGKRFACFLERDHTVWCSGTNDAGQLGNGMTSAMPTAIPVQVVDAAGPITDATAVQATQFSACAIRTGGEVWCWGRGGSGVLGNDAVANQPAAVRVVKAGAVALTGIVELAGGWSHACGRDQAGGVWCWGSDSNNQLGDGLTTQRNVAAPVLVAAGGAPFTGATALISGGDHACARKANNEVWCWGGNYDGQMGDTTTANHPSPVMIATSTSVAGGSYYTCWVNADTTVSCAGSNYHGNLGIGTGGNWNGADELAPKSVVSAVGGPPFTGAVEVATGSSMACARTTAGQVACWGENNYGQTGAGAGNPVPSLVLTRSGTGAVPLGNVDKLIAHFPHACAHTTDRGWMCWGRNRDGELGVGTFTNLGLATPTGLTCP